MPPGSAQAQTQTTPKSASAPAAVRSAAVPTPASAPSAQPAPVKQAAPPIPAKSAPPAANPAPPPVRSAQATRTSVQQSDPLPPLPPFPATQAPAPAARPAPLASVQQSDPLPPLPAQPVRAPVTQAAPPQPAPAQPAKPVPAARYTGPTSGALTWSGQMDKGATITLDGSTASQGTLNGSLPGVPVLIDVAPADIGIAESPSPSNGWKRLVLRSQKSRNIVVTIHWRTL